MSSVAVIDMAIIGAAIGVAAAMSASASALSGGGFTDAECAHAREGFAGLTCGTIAGSTAKSGADIARGIADSACGAEGALSVIAGLPKSGVVWGREAHESGSAAVSFTERACVTSA